MDPHPTYDDVNLVLRLYEMRRETRLRQAREWFAHTFKARSLEELETLCPYGSDENAYFRMVVSYWEMVASFITAGVLNEKLFFQSGREMLFVWERIRDLVPLMRAARKDPGYFRNLETVTKSFMGWMEQTSPGSYEPFSQRVKG
jgi:hypothetical protein